MAVLVAAAAVFALLVAANGLTTWTGPGMSMFSTVDHQGNRAVRVWVQTFDGDGMTEARVPASLHGDAKELRRAPSTKRASRLASELLELSWARADDHLEAGDGTAAIAVRVAVVNVYVEADGLTERLLVKSSTGP